MKPLRGIASVREAGSRIHVALRGSVRDADSTSSLPAGETRSGATQRGPNAPEELEVRGHELPPLHCWHLPRQGRAIRHRDTPW
jgi:hypothetical protein